MGTAGHDLPSYDELPIRPGLPPGSSWAVWGDRDVLGCLNLLGPAQVRAGLESVVDRAVFSLNLDLALPSPPLFGRQAFQHEVLDIGGSTVVGHDELLHGWNPQGSSQWDGFRHIRHPVYGFYGGTADEDHGVHHWADKGIVGRGVLCDIDGYRAVEHADRDSITADDVRGALDAQGVSVEVGDILLVHTGWLDWYRGRSPADRAAIAANRLPATGMRTPGLRSGTSTLRLLWDLHVAAIAADNPAVEAWPPGDGDPVEQFLHFSALPLLGLPLGELWDLGALARACRADGRWTCLLTSAPLNLAAGVGSPANALAVR